MIEPMSTYVLKTTAKLYYNTLQQIHNYVSSQTIQSKRTRLWEGNLKS